MAFAMDGAFDLPASRDVVWRALNDADVLKACIPGCEELEKKSETEFVALVKVKIGPVSAKFRGSVQLNDLDPPSSYRIDGQGDGGAAGFAKGSARVVLTESAKGGTLLTYDVEALIGGKLAQLGGRLINGVAKQLADEFFTNFAREFAPDGESMQTTVAAADLHPAVDRADRPHNLFARVWAALCSFVRRLRGIR